MPCHPKCQTIWTEQLQLPLMTLHEYLGQPKTLGKPTKIYKIQGDGNCLFRALSYLITGRQSYHSHVRTKVIEHMKDIEAILQPHIDGNVRDYLARTRMATNTVWVTDIEILTAASLLGTDIFVYTKLASFYKWQRFPESVLVKNLQQHKGALYLKNTAGIHYDVVLNVNSDVAEVEGCCSKQLFSDIPLVNNSNDSIETQQAEIGSTSNSNPSVKKNPNYLTKPKLCDRSETAADFHPINKHFEIQNGCFGPIPQPVTIKNINSFGDNDNIPQVSGLPKHKRNLSNFHRSMQFVMLQCKVCREAWPLHERSKSKDSHVCRRCSVDKGTPKKFSVENDMIPSPVPKELQGLTQIEEMLIARALPIMKVYIKPGGQRGYAGHSINLPQKVTDLAELLPRYPKDIPLIVVTMTGKNDMTKDVTVRKEKVEQALNWLIKNNPVYQNVKVNLDSLNSLPICGVPNDIKTTETNNVLTEEENDNSHCDSEETENDNSYCDSEETDDQVYNKDTETSSFLPQSENSELEHDAIQNHIGTNRMNWPTVMNEPINEYTTAFLATLAFPTLFPDGKADPTNPSTTRDVNFINKVKHLLKFAESVNGKWNFRFASHPRFSYWTLNMIQRKRALQQTSVFFKQNPGEAHLTTEELKDMARKNLSGRFMTRLSRYVGNITGSSSYWHKVQQDLKTIVAQKGPPTIFFTFSSADMHWPDLHKLLTSNVDDLSSETRRQNVINNPHIVDCFLRNVWKVLLNIGCMAV